MAAYDTTVAVRILQAVGLGLGLGAGWSVLDRFNPPAPVDCDAPRCSKARYRAVERVRHEYQTRIDELERQARSPGQTYIEHMCTERGWRAPTRARH